MSDITEPNSDLSCHACKGFLYQPVILPCGHVFCEPCCRERSVVQQLHSSGHNSDTAWSCCICNALFFKFPRPCLPLVQFLQHHYPQQYNLRQQQTESGAPIVNESVCIERPSLPITEDEFKCGVCWDLLWRPSALPCGHWFCFWCINQAMDPFTGVKCPLCREADKAMPATCDWLHRFLQRLFPERFVERSQDVATLESQVKHVIRRSSANTNSSSVSSSRQPPNSTEQPVGASDDQRSDTSQTSDEEAEDDEWVELEAPRGDLDNPGEQASLGVGASADPNYQWYCVGCDGCGLYRIKQVRSSL
jgi:hypothetical protein